MEPSGQSPVDLYQQEYQEKFAARTHETIEAAVRAAGINERANAELAAKIDKLIKNRESVRRMKAVWAFLLTFIVITVFGWGGYLMYRKSEGYGISTEHSVSFWAVTCALIGLSVCVCILKIRSFSKALDALNAEIDEKIAAAQAQLRPFYDQFRWNTIPKLIEEVVPYIRFDDFFTRGRLEDLEKNFGLNFSFLAEKSMLFTHSGSLYGYPFLFMDLKTFQWGEKTYYGYKKISWTEREKGADGKMHTVTKTETLSASVTKPYPEFSEEKFFFFGHDAAPELNFSRAPSPLARSHDDSFFSKFRKKSKLKKLRKFEQNLTDESNFTMMSNQDFEVYFNSTNRTDEIAYRLLFTPLAQQQMVQLLLDKDVGYGDDFAYHKLKKYTLMSSVHLNQLPFSTEPFRLDAYDLKVVKRHFTDRFMKFFKSVYFTFAPLLTIPLYQEPRTEIPETEVSSLISYLEMESLANYQGDSQYAHPECTTESLLKVTRLHYHGNQVTATVKARGFKGIERTTTKTVMGGDHKRHDVDVDWIEYEEVIKESQVEAVTATDETLKDTDRNYAYYRRSILANSPTDQADK